MLRERYGYGRVMKEEKGFNNICITQTAATICGLLGIPSHEGAAAPISEVLEKAGEAFGGAACDRVFFYNPDAVAMWIYEKYQDYFIGLEKRAGLRLPELSVVPPVTPVCFGSMYSGMQPGQHGIQKYEKPVLKVNTVFDDAAAAGKKAAIVSTEGDSISKIFLERPMDYFIYPSKEECNEKAMELIEEDRHDLIVLYNGDYDYQMHRHTPEGRRPLKALRENIETFSRIYDRIGECWKSHNSVVAFAPDHGCHRACLILGNHGIDKPCDMNIMHFYGFLDGNKGE